MGSNQPFNNAKAATSLARLVLQELALLAVEDDSVLHGRKFTNTTVDLAAATAPQYGRSAVVRRIVLPASGFAAEYRWRWWPGDGWTYDGVNVADARGDLEPNTAVHALQQPMSASTVRLAWRHDDGRLLLDELTPAYARGSLLDEHTGPRAAADLSLGEHLAGDRFIGVRLLPPRVPEHAGLLTPDHREVPLRSSAAAHLTIKEDR